MTLREFFLERLAAETPVFLKVLRSLPADAIDYRPHERSPSAGQVVWTLTLEMVAAAAVAREHQAEWKTPPQPPLEEMTALFERSAGELAERVASLDEAGWDRPARFYYGGKMVSEQPAGQFLWFILFDAIHHRGQLSAYLRPMGGKVPSIYGPSADEPSA